MESKAGTRSEAGRDSGGGRPPGAEAADHRYWRDLVANGPLMRAVADFNRDLHSPAAPVFAPSPGSGQESAPDSEASGRVKAFALAAAASPRLRGLFPGRGPDPDFWDFGPEPRRLMLLGRAEFDELALRFGAAAWGGALARLVDGPAVRAARSALGADLLDWAVGRGRFWLGRLGPVWRRGAGPPLERDGLRLTGLRAINEAWRPLPPALAARAGDRLWIQGGPSDRGQAGGGPDGSPLSGPFPDDDHPRRASPEAPPDDLRAATFARLKRILLTEVAPSWRPCFS